MGAFVVNLHVRTPEHETLVREIRDLRTGGCYVAPAKRGWTSVYEQRLSTQDDDWIRHFGSELSRRMQVPAIAFLVHDSDFVCYWLFDKGDLLDEFNSCPDYFADDWSDTPAVETMRGRPDVLRRYCPRGVSVADVESALEQESLFAEGQLETIAGLLDIDSERAMGDFNDFGRNIEPQELNATLVVEGETERAGPFSSLSATAGGLSLFRGEEDEADDVQASGFVARNLQRLFGGSPAATPADPLVVQLVEAASKGDVAAIEQLVAAGADINGMAPLKFDLNRQLPGIGQMAMGIVPTFELTPLLAAVNFKRLEAARKLVELNADVKILHPLFGSVVHTAAGSGSPEMLELLLASGARVNEKNGQGQTPLAALQAARQVLSQFTRLQSLGLPLPKAITDHLKQALPVAGWDECERILRDAGGK